MDTPSPAELAAAATVLTLTEERQQELWAAAGLFECTECGRTFESEIALMFCCAGDD